VQFLYFVLATCCALLLVAGVVERRRHQRALNAIPHRVVINGIRGKSSITRLCAGALRAGGLRTVAKTTGSAARLIRPDGTDEPVYRRFGLANVAEQVTLVRRCAAFKPDVMVMECMAVQPDLQEFNQEVLIQASIVVLSNVRADHLEEMGPTLDDVARSLCRSMPRGGVCVTAERERLSILREEAARRDCAVVVADPASVTEADLAGFSQITFPDNVAIALVLADLLRVPRHTALSGMWQAPPDPGALTVRRLRADDREFRFANVFAANDPESTMLNISQLLDRGDLGQPLHLVINCRRDRVERNAQMGALVGRLDPARVVLIGDAVSSARAAIGADWRAQVTELPGALGGPALLAGLLDGLPSAASVVAVGNIHGQGELLLDQLAQLPEQAADERGMRT
jgi:poly-gamma-glutamate synthase PgsB/CapB